MAFKRNVKVYKEKSRGGGSLSLNEYFGFIFYVIHSFELNCNQYIGFRGATTVESWDNRAPYGE